MPLGRGADDPVTLRWRLVLALLGLLAVGLVVFGVVTYQLYARSQYDRLDGQLAGEARSMVVDLFAGGPQLELDVGGQLPGSDPDDEAEEPDDTPPGPAGHSGLFGLCAVELAPDGQVLKATRSCVEEDGPRLPEDLHETEGSRFLTVKAADGSGKWRVYVSDGADPALPGVPVTLVVAASTSDVQSSLDRLLVVETVAALGLLAVLAVGAWMILQRSLQPLERMATTANTITAGELGTRVEPVDERSEVGQLGQALNTMLGRLEESFREQEATERRLRQFLADASHELRTPLTSIQGFAELFRLGANQDPADRAVTMRRIEEEAGRMRTLVDDLLLLARLDQTRPVERVPVDLAVLAADACTDAVAAEPGRPVTLDAPEPVMVAGDPDHLRQAIGNLVTNALRHTPAGTPVEVGARLTGSPSPQPGDAGPAPESLAGGEVRALVTVRDHGAGLDAEALAHAFDRLWQADPSRSDAGAGLGLSIVAAIAAEHDGWARAENAPDGGALFTLDLPVNGVGSPGPQVAR